MAQTVGDRDCVEVFCRMRPLPSDENEFCAQTDDDQTLRLFPPKSWVPSRQLNNPKEVTCCYRQMHLVMNLYNLDREHVHTGVC